MVYLVATDRILAALEAVPISQRTELDLPTSLTRHGPMAHEQLLRLAKHLQSEAADTTTNTLPGPTALSFLLRGTKVYVPPPPKKPEPVRPDSSLSLSFHSSFFCAEQLQTNRPLQDYLPK